MIHFIFAKQDPRYLFLKADTQEDELWIRSNDKHDNLQDWINLVDPICYLAANRGKPQFTQDFLFSYVQQSGKTVYYCAIGLWQEIAHFFKKHNVKFDGLQKNKDMLKQDIQHSFEKFKAIVDSWQLHITPRSYQYEAAYKILQWKQSISSLATRAGKTLIAYIVFRYAMEYMGVKKILMIVPSIDLVKQGYKDFADYQEFFKTECIWSGGKLVESSNLTIGTFQSLIKFLDRKDKKYNPHFYDGYDLVFVDETHRATARQMKTIISQPFMKNVKIAFGMTGTIPEEHTIPYYCLKSLLGATIQKITPRELMDEGYISDVQIYQVRIHYKNEDKVCENYMKCAEYAIGDFVMEDDVKHPGKKKKIPLDNPQFQIKWKKSIPFGVREAKQRIFYGFDFENPYIDIQDDMYKTCRGSYLKELKKIIAGSNNSNALVVERMTTHFMDERVRLLVERILAKCDKNTLILGHHTEYLRNVFDIVKAAFPMRHVELITGAVDSKARDRIKNLLKENDDCILVASYGVLSTGITLNNLCFGVFLESFKSNVINMQSIGRGLGLKTNSKDPYILYDLVDCFDRQVLTNKIYLQGLVKIKIYEKEKYPYKVVNITI